MQTSGKKVLVIGLDGATFRMIDPMLARGELPNLDRVIRGGARGVLRSTINPNSWPAWVSFMTGMNPGGHGVFSPHRMKAGSYSMETVDYRGVKAPAIWDIAGAAGRTCGVINVPVTYPAPPVNGFMVSGFNAPSGLADSVYPESLKEEIFREFPDYDVDIVADIWNKKKTWGDAQRRITDRRLLAKFLHEKYNPDLFIVVFTMSDRIQHVFWGDMDPSHPFHKRTSGEFADVVPRMYRLLDEAVGELCAMVGPDIPVFILSDHGFLGMREKFHINLYLSRLGLLKYRTNVRGVAVKKMKEAASALGLTKLVRRLAPMVENTAQEIRSAITREIVDWGRTKVFADQNCGIRVNMKSEYPMGVVESQAERSAILRDLHSRLLEERHPKTGQNLFKQVCLREEVYSGEYVGAAPNLYLIPTDPSLMLWPSHEAKSIIREIDFPAAPGGHDHDGIFLAAGPGIAPGRAIETRPIHDTAAAILHALGVPVPENLDGKVITSIYEDDWLRKNPVESQPPFTARAAAAAAKEISSDEEEEMARRLRGLGYIE